MSEINRSVQPLEPLEFTVRFDFDVACRRAKYQFPDQRRETIDADFDITIGVNGEAQKFGGGYISSLITEEDIAAWTRSARSHIEEHFAGVLRQAAIDMMNEAQWHNPHAPEPLRLDPKKFVRDVCAKVSQAIKARLGVRGRGNKPLPDRNNPHLLELFGGLQADCERAKQSYIERLAARGERKPHGFRVREWRAAWSEYTAQVSWRTHAVICASALDNLPEKQSFSPRDIAIIMFACARGCSAETARDMIEEAQAASRSNTVSERIELKP